MVFNVEEDWEGNCKDSKSCEYDRVSPWVDVTSQVLQMWSAVVFKRVYLDAYKTQDQACYRCSEENRTSEIKDFHCLYECFPLRAFTDTNIRRNGQVADDQADGNSWNLNVELPLFLGY